MDTKTNQMAADLHLIATPFRVVMDMLKMTLFMLSVPLLCGAGLLSYAFHGQLDPFATFMTWAHAHPSSWVSYPFYVLAGILALAAKMVLVIGHDCGGLFALVMSVPMVGALLVALIAAWWFVVVRAVYCGIDGEKPSVRKGFWFAFVGFIIAFIVALYVSEVTTIVSAETETGAAAIFSLGVLAVASPSLLYMLSRIFKSRQPVTDTF